MKVYIAALYSRREEMRAVADRLTAAGHEVTAQWVYGAEEGMSQQAKAQMDVDDVRRADVCLSYTEPYGSYNRGGGRNVEFGIAYEAGKVCMIIGQVENIFHELPNIVLCRSLDDAIAAMDAWSR